MLRGIEWVGIYIGKIGMVFIISNQGYIAFSEVI